MTTTRKGTASQNQSLEIAIICHIMEAMESTNQDHMKAHSNMRIQSKRKNQDSNPHHSPYKALLRKDLEVMALSHGKGQLMEINSRCNHPQLPLSTCLEPAMMNSKLHTQRLIQ